ncbi:hypothetical protein pclt_cds_1171 [Pandoravirus celtis]|uniref:Uncharacterized protein n=1 Tax=Pandoravirus celtis TaxID=2568002 RepID=A0A4D6EK99_9VIRU|nr:hypothetical protein pclt_cds_1171 [Pandoravirus celtis]
MPLAWRRFHVLTGADFAARRCRYSTLLSLCAAGDLDGLHYAASRPEVFGPVAGFRWDACLYVAVVGDRVDILDHIKGRIVAMASPEKSTMPDSQETWTYTLLDELRFIHSVSQNPTVDTPTWPLMPAPWLALAVAAVRCDIDGPLAWLCAKGNRPTRMIAVEDVASARKMLQKVPRQCAWSLWHRLRLDIGVALKNTWAAQNMTVNEMCAIAERVSDASGLDVVGLFQRSSRWETMQTSVEPYWRRLRCFWHQPTWRTRSLGRRGGPRGHGRSIERFRQCLKGRLAHRLTWRPARAACAVRRRCRRRRSKALRLAWHVCKVCLSVVGFHVVQLAIAGFGIARSALAVRMRRHRVALRAREAARDQRPTRHRLCVDRSRARGHNGSGRPARPHGRVGRRPAECRQSGPGRRASAGEHPDSVHVPACGRHGICAR